MFIFDHIFVWVLALAIHSLHPGDWKYIAEALMLSALWSAKYVCHLCRAHKTIRRLWWTNFARTDRLRRTRVSNKRYIGWNTNGPFRNQSVFIRLRGFNIWRVWQDAMHTLDLGLYQYIGPSVLFELVSNTRLWHATSRAGRLMQAHGAYKIWCKQHKVMNPIAPFQAVSFRRKKSNIVQWTQKAAKGAQMKHFIFWLRDVCESSLDESNYHELVRLSLLNSIVEFESACAGEGRFPSTGTLPIIEDAVECMLHCYKYLANEAKRSGLYHIVPKAHMHTHMGYDMAKKANPRRVHCYSDEDLIGKLKRILEHCHGLTAHTRALQRYIIWAALRWWILQHRLLNIPLG